MHCKHCYIESPNKLYDQISTDQAFFVIDKIMRNGINNFFITGGEPLLRDDILSIFQRIIDKGGKITGIDSNGTILSGDIIDFFKRNNIFINISHDGVDFTNRNRGGNIEDKVLESIKILVQAGIRTNINTAINPENLNGIIELFDVLKDIKINQWLLFTSFNTGLYKENFKMLSVNEEIEIYKILKNKWLCMNKPFEIRLGNVFDSMNSNAKWVNYVCEYFRDTISLFPDGQLTPCCKYIIHENYMEFPNIFKNSDDQIFKKSILAEIKNFAMERIFERNPECKDCDLLDTCNTGCRMEAYLCNKEMNLKDLRNCDLMKSSKEIAK